MIEINGNYTSYLIFDRFSIYRVRCLRKIIGKKINLFASNSIQLEKVINFDFKDMYFPSEFPKV